MKTQHCDRCKHSTYIDKKKLVREGCFLSYKDVWSHSEHICDKGHKPRFYKPRKDYLYNDVLSGYKRKCEDFEEVK